MGHNATVVVMVDAAQSIADDPDFGRKLADAISKVACYGKPEDVSAGWHVNAASVIEAHHADYDVLVSVGGNYGKVVEVPGVSESCPLCRRVRK